MKQRGHAEWGIRFFFPLTRWVFHFSLLYDISLRDPRRTFENSEKIGPFDNLINCVHRS